MQPLQAALNIANVHLAAELLGIANECFDRTLHYLKDRKQFGVAIGSFQALQHRAAILWMEIELCKSVVLKALRALDESPQDAALLASTAKAKACQTAELASNEGNPDARRHRYDRRIRHGVLSQTRPGRTNAIRRLSLPCESLRGVVWLLSDRFSRADFFGGFCTSSTR